MTSLVIARSRRTYSHCEGAAEPALSAVKGPRRGLRPLAMTVFASGLLSGCTSPEARRTRGDGPGADVKNWGHPVELHAGAQPYHHTPCVTEVECRGPLPVFGPTPPPD